MGEATLFLPKHELAVLAFRATPTYVLALCSPPVIASCVSSSLPAICEYAHPHTSCKEKVRCSSPCPSGTDSRPVEPASGSCRPSPKSEAKRGFGFDWRGGAESSLRGIRGRLHWSLLEAKWLSSPEAKGVADCQFRGTCKWFLRSCPQTRRKISFRLLLAWRSTSNSSAEPAVGPTGICSRLKEY